MRRNLVIILALLSLIVLVAPFASAQPLYEAIRIIPDSGSSFAPVRLNDLGQVLLTMSKNSFRGPWIWHSDNDSLEELSGFEGWGVEAIGLNDLGDICGIWRDAGPNENAFSWSDGVRKVLVPENSDLDPDRWGGRAEDINDAGMAVGRSSSHSGIGGCWWPSPSTPAQLLPPFGEFQQTAAYAINDGGSIVGISHSPLIFVDTSGATLWESGGGAISIGYHTAEGRRFAVPTDINNSGWIVGWAIGGGLSTAQAALVRGTEVTILHDPALQGAYWQAKAINDSGLIVAQAERPFLWDDGVRYDLDDLIFGLEFTDGTPLQPLLGVADINNKGDILCSSAFYRVLLRKIEPPPPGLVVNSTADFDDLDSLDGRCYTGNQTPQGQDECTLRAAIQYANRNPGRDTILFSIPEIGGPVIKPESPLPAITEAVNIDGSSQAFASGVQLDGTDADSGGTSTDGLVFRGGGSYMSCVAIYNFSGNGLTLQDGDTNFVEDCLLGSNLAEDKGLGNFGHGIFIKNSSHNRIGGFNRRNAIVQNLRSGIFVHSGVGNIITGNFIADNGGLGIDLAPEGVTDNDSADVDEGPNRIQNFPVIDSVRRATFSAAAMPETITIYGTISPHPTPVSVLLEFFKSDSCDITGHGEGSEFVGDKVVNVSGTAPNPFSVTLVIPTSLDGGYLTATATDEDGNTSEFSLCWPRKTLEIVDVNGAPIPSMTFALSTVRDDAPLFTEEFIDSITTDDAGRYSLDSLLRAGHFGTGVPLKLSRTMHSEPGAQQNFHLSTAYSIELDNADFDSLTYVMSFDKFDQDTVQTIKLEHTTVALNYFVGVLWDADPAYLQTLRQGFRNLSNHLYDVSDGQMRIDTVFINDNHAPNSSADILISSGLGPSVWIGNQVDGDLDVQFLSMTLPRSYYPTNDAARDHGEFPPDAGQINHYRMTALLLAKTTLGLDREQPIRSFNCLPQSFGFMGRSQFDESELTGPNIELSWDRHYSRTHSDCLSTWQYERNGASCWDYLERRFEGTYDDLFVPIIKPDERPGVTPDGAWFGPNDGFDDRHLPIQFDLGPRVVFRGEDKPSAARSVTVELKDPTPSQIEKGVFIRYFPGEANAVYGDRNVLPQGQTSKQGRVLALGVLGGHLDAYSQAEFTISEFNWSIGSIEVPDKSAASSASRPAGTPDDVFSLSMEQVYGDYPLICDLRLNETGTTFALTAKNHFASLPTLQLIPSAGDVQDVSFTSTAAGYTTEINGDFSSSGSLRVEAVDDSAKTFSFMTDYRITEIPENTPFIEASSFSGDLELDLDSVNTGVERVMVNSSPYPILADGLDPESRLVGDVHSISLYPHTMPAGTNQLRITYSDSDLDTSAVGFFGREESIQIYCWLSGQSIWLKVGGTVYAEFNMIVSDFTEPGIYAAFTTADAPDDTPPNLTIGVLQNPILPSYVDIYVIASEPISGLPAVTVNGTTLTVTEVSGGGEPTYSGSHEITGSGVITIQAIATDFAANVGQATENFESFPVGVQATHWESKSQDIQLTIEAAAVGREQTILVFRSTGRSGQFTFDFRPHTLALQIPARLRIKHDDHFGHDVAIMRRLADGGWEALPTQFDTESGMLVANIERLGIFEVRPYTGPAAIVPRSPTLEQNYPNPFNSGTVIAFILTANEHVQLEVYDILGRHVALLIDEPQTAGQHAVSWDGRTANGTLAASGVYFYRLRTKSATLSRQMVLIK